MKKSEIYRTLGRPVEAAEREQEKAKDNEAGAFGKIGATVLELLVGAPTKGAIKSIEGIYDAHVGAIGAIGGAFDEDFKENLGKHIAFDATGWLTDAIGYDKVEDASFLDDGKVGNFVRDVEQGIGGMAPSVALSAIPYAGAVLGPVSMGMAAGGNNMESALQNDAGYYNAWLYGLGSGALEGAIESVGGFALGKSSTLVSKMLSGTKLGKVASSVLGKVAESFISEAGEEIVTDLSDPAMLAATGVDTNIVENYKKTIKGLPRTGLLGGTIGMVMGGGSTALGGVRNSSRGGFKASRADNSMEYISKVSKYYDKDVSKHGKYDKAIDDALYDISRELTAMSKEQRTNYMSTMGLYKNAFNEDGSIKSDLRADINTGAVSSNLRAISATLKHKPLSADTELTDGASKAKSYVEKMLGEGANVVVTSDNAQNNAFYNEDEGIVYINNNAAFSGEEIAEFVATHEVAHITEGTRAYGEMALMLEEIAKDPKAPAALKAKIGDIKARKKQIRDAYAGQMQGMNIAQREFLVDTELNADLVGILLGDEYFIEKLAQRDASLVEKIFNKLKSLNKKSASVDRESAKYLSKLVNKFGRAINKSQGGVKISQLGREDEEKGAEVENERYSFAGKKARIANRKTLEKAEKMLAEGIDTETIRKETGWFKGYDGKWRFEIDDSQMVIKDNVSNYTDLENLIEHDVLFEAYPELKKVGVIFCDLGESRGGYDRQFGYIEIDYSLKGDKQDLRYTLIHEIQHAIQHIEDFARGASPKHWERKLAEGFDSRQAFVKQEENELLEKIKKKRHENRDFIEDIEFLSQSTPNKPRGKIDWETFEKIEEDPPEWKSYDRMRDSLSDKYGESNVFEYIDVLSKLEYLKHYGERYAHDLYWLTAGEIESRDVSKRLELDSQERKNTRPNIDEPDVVFAEDKYNERFSDEGEPTAQNKKITLGMSDAERATILKNTIIQPQEIEISNNFDVDAEALRKNQKSKIEKPLVKKLQELGCLRKYSTSNVDVEFSFTGNSLRKSMNSQVSDYGGTLEDLSKVVMNMQKLLDSSALIEIHNDKAKKSDKEKTRLVKTFVLLSAFQEVNGTTPVQFEIMQYTDNENRLYLAVALTKIETSVMGDTALRKEGRTRLLPVSNISISQLIKKINPADENFFKYIPDEMLSKEQVISKRRALEKENKKYGRTIDGNRYSKSKSERFTQAQYTQMSLAEELVKGYDEGALSSEEALRKLNALGYKTGINTDNALERLEELIPEIREYATSEREAYRESNKKEVSPSVAKATAPSSEGAMTEEDANRQAQDSLDYWVKNGDQFYGSVKYLKNGKVKVKLAQTANEVRLAKFINNNIMGKAYTNQDVKSIIDKVLTNSNIWGADDSGSYMAKLKGEDLSAVKKQLWAALNTAPEGERIGPALDIADYIVKHGILTEIVEVTEDVYYAQSIIDTLEPYKRKIDISHIKSDIEAKFDTDRAPFGLWAQKKSDTSRGFTADEVGQALEEAGIVLSGDRGKLINEADIFIAMHKLYTEAQAIIKAATPTKNDIIGAYDAKEAHEIKQKIAREILRSYDEYGKETSFARLEKKFRGEIASLKKRVSEVYELNRAKNEMLYLAGKFQDKKKGKFHNATQAQNEALNGIISVLSKLKYRSDINKSSSRALLDELAKWYTEENPLLQGGAVDKKTSESKGFYSPYIKELIDYFRIDNEDGAVNNKPLKIDEIYAINKILAHMNFVVENFGKIWRHGKWIDAKDVGTKQLEIFNSAVQNQTVITRLVGNKFTDNFMDPEVIFSRLDGGDREGFFLSALWDLREADIKQRYLEMLALRELDEFEKNNKKYIKDFMSDKTTLTVGAKIDLRAEGGPTADPLKIPKYAAVDLYLVSKTGNAIDTFEETGWFLKLDGKKSEKQQATITKGHIKELEKQFTEKDWELIKILEKQYNGNLRQLKFETDMIRLGMSNVFDGYYYPINRRGASDLDSNDFFFMMERVGNSPFNNSRVRGAKNAIIVSNALTKFKRHVNGVTRYASYAVPIENINKILNVDVGNNANMPTSMQTALKTNDFARGAEDYLKKLIADAQQVNIKSDDATKFVSQLRGRYAKYQLGFNLKVLFTQASSYIAGFGELRASSLAWAVAHLPKLTNKAFDAELDKYCPWAAVRHYEKGATRAMTVTDKISKAGDFFTMGIEFMDRQIVKLEFLACQHEAKVRYHLEIGTEENKIKAGELLTELGLKTQQNQLTTEKSAAMRSESEFAKTLTMFKADSMKQVSRWLQAVSTASVLRRKMQAAKQAGDMATYNALEAEYKKSVKTICKYSSVIVVSSIYMVMLARLFNKFYGRDEEDDENKILGFFKDIFGNICGMIPIVSELYSFFFEGYDTGSFMYDSINNVLSASKGVVDTCVSLVGGENVSKEKINSSIRDVIYALGISTGIPTKNAYKVTKGILDLIAPNAGDKVDAWFKAPSEKSLEENIKASIEKGNDKAVSSSLALLYDKYDLKLEDAVLRREYDRLMRLEMAKAEDDSAKYSPLEAKIPSNLIVDGEEVELLKKDINTFKNAFLVAEKSQASVVKTAPYKKLKDEERAYALRKISQFYYEETKYSYTGEKSNFTYYAKVVGIEDLALILAYAKNLKGDARQSRREKIEAYIKGLGLNAVKTSLALRCLGYSDKDNDELVKGYIGRASVLSKEERAELLKILE